ncbi:unnamed protein product [Closterium sp. Naga37s-1]|nr:unnamed protein product [Closterium sp. Naga37s-1]
MRHVERSLASESSSQCEQWPESCWPVPHVPFSYLSNFSRRKYLVVAFTMEQMSNARTHLAEAARVAEESGRILVLPNADCSRLSVARQHPLCSYWDLSRFSRVEWVSSEFFLLTARAAFLNPSVGFVCVKTEVLRRPCFNYRELKEILGQVLTFSMGHVPVPSNTIDVKMPQSKDVFNMLLHAWSDRDVVVWMKTTFQRIDYVPKTDVVARAVLPYRAKWHDMAAQITARLPKPVIGVHFRSEFISWNMVRTLWDIVCGTMGIKSWACTYAPDSSLNYSLILLLSDSPPISLVSLPQAQGLNANLTWEEVQHNLRQQMAVCVQGAASKINQVRKKLQTQHWQEQVQQENQGKQGQKQEQLINGLGQVVEGPTVFIAADIPFNASAAVQPRSESWQSMEVWLGRANTGRASRGALKWLRQHVGGTVMIDEVVPAVNGYDPGIVSILDKLVIARADIFVAAEGRLKESELPHSTPLSSLSLPFSGIVSILDKLVIAKADIFVAAEGYWCLTAPQLPLFSPVNPHSSVLSALPTHRHRINPRQAGIVSILDKLVIAKADIFVAAEQYCGGKRGFESDILQHRDEYGQAADSVVRWGYEKEA